MTRTVDYRSDKMLTQEGEGRALGAWQAFVDEEFVQVVTEAALSAREFPRPSMPLEEMESDAREKVAEVARRRSELLGFWLAWHLAGGFARLQEAGWHRATIFRKVGQFRGEFGVHPDVASFEWIDLDLRTAWRRQVVDGITQHGSDDEPTILEDDRDDEPADIWSDRDDEPHDI